MSDITFCKADPEQLALADAIQSAWPTPELPWTILDELPRVSYDEFKAAMDWGLKGWSKVSRLRPYFTERIGEARLLIRTRKLDGPGGVLADCELPNGSSRQVNMRIDLGDEWDADLTTPASRKIKLGVVGRHEGGHGIGIGHAPKNSKNWMAPAYDPSVVLAGVWDANQAIARYGEAAALPPSTPPAMPPTSGDTGMFATFMKLLPVIQWFIANKDQLVPLLAALKSIFDAFQNLPAKTQALSLELVDKASFRSAATQWAHTLRATAALTPWPWDDAAAAILAQAVSTDWLMDFLYEVALGRIVVTESLLNDALAGNAEQVRLQLTGQ